MRTSVNAFKTIEIPKLTRSTSSDNRNQK